MTTASPAVVEIFPASNLKMSPPKLRTSELAHVKQVVKRDEKLRKIEESRIKNIGNQLGVRICTVEELKDYAVVSPKENTFTLEQSVFSAPADCNDSGYTDKESTMNSTLGLTVDTCVVCSHNFGVVLNRKKCCFVCRMMVCSNCCIVIVHEQSKLHLCRICERRRLVKERAVQWFYFCIRKRFIDANSGADWFKNYVKEYTTVDIACQTASDDEEVFNPSTFQGASLGINNVWMRITRQGEGNEKGGKAEILPLRDHCELELVNDLSALMNEVKSLVDKVDGEEYEAINAIANVYKKRMALTLTQYTNLFYIVMLIGNNRDVRQNMSKSRIACKNCDQLNGDQHVNDEFCQHSDLILAARSAIEQTTASVMTVSTLKTPKPCLSSTQHTHPPLTIVSPFNEQSVSESQAGSFEEHIASTMIDEAIKQTFFGKIETGSQSSLSIGKLVMTDGRIGLASRDLLTPDPYSGRLSVNSYGSRRSNNDEGVYSDMSSLQNANTNQNTEQEIEVFTQYQPALTGQNVMASQETDSNEASDLSERENMDTLSYGSNKNSISAIEISFQSQQGENNFAFAQISPDRTAVDNTGSNERLVAVTEKLDIESLDEEYQSMFSQFSPSPDNEMIGVGQSMMISPDSSTESGLSFAVGIVDDSFRFYPSTDETPSSIPVDTIRVCDGENAQFSLTIRSDCEITSVTWFLVDDSVEEISLIEITNGTKYSVSVDTNLSDLTIVEISCTLEIMNACVQDSGKYLCKVNNTGGKSIARILSLTVVQSSGDDQVPSSHPPEFILQPEEIYHVHCGKSLTLRTAVSAFPEAKIFWLKQEEEIDCSDDRISVVEVSSRESILQINRLVKEDEARYMVVAENSVGRAQAITHILVTDKKSMKDNSYEIKKMHDSDASKDCTFSNVTITGVISPPAFQATPYSTRQDNMNKQNCSLERMSPRVTGRLPQTIVKTADDTSDMKDEDVTISKSINQSRLSVRELALLFTNSQRKAEKSFEQVGSITCRKGTSPSKYSLGRKSLHANYKIDESCSDNETSILRPQRSSFSQLSNSNSFCLNETANGDLQFNKDSRNVIFTHNDD